MMRESQERSLTNVTFVKKKKKQKLEKYLLAIIGYNKIQSEQPYTLSGGDLQNLLLFILHGLEIIWEKAISM